MRIAMRCSHIYGPEVQLSEADQKSFIAGKLDPNHDVVVCPDCWRKFKETSTGFKWEGHVTVQSRRKPHGPPSAPLDEFLAEEAD